MGRMDMTAHQAIDRFQGLTDEFFNINPMSDRLLAEVSIYRGTASSLVTESLMSFPV